MHTVPPPAVRTRSRAALALRLPSWAAIDTWFAAWLDPRSAAQPARLRLCVA